MKYYKCCTDCTIEEHTALMKDAYPIDYNELIEKIKKEMPRFYDEMYLHLDNPYSDMCCQTDTHYILVHSAIEYFINK